MVELATRLKTSDNGFLDCPLQPSILQMWWKLEPEGEVSWLRQDSESEQADSRTGILTLKTRACTTMLQEHQELLPRQNTARTRLP